MSVDLKKLKISELKKILKEAKIKGITGLKKDELIKLVMKNNEKLGLDIMESQKKQPTIKINYGIGELKTNEKRPTQEQALKANQVRYWGKEQIDKKLLEKKQKGMKALDSGKMPKAEVTNKIKATLEKFNKELQEDKKRSDERNKRMKELRISIIRKRPANQQSFGTSEVKEVKSDIEKYKKELEKDRKEMQEIKEKIKQIKDLKKQEKNVPAKDAPTISNKIKSTLEKYKKELEEDKKRDAERFKQLKELRISILKKRPANQQGFFF